MSASKFVSAYLFEYFLSLLQTLFTAWVHKGIVLLPSLYPTSLHAMNNIVTQCLDATDIQYYGRCGLCSDLCTDNICTDSTGNREQHIDEWCPAQTILVLENLLPGDDITKASPRRYSHTSILASYLELLTKTVPCSDIFDYDIFATNISSWSRVKHLPLFDLSQFDSYSLLLIYTTLCARPDLWPFFLIYKNIDEHQLERHGTDKQIVTKRYRKLIAKAKVFFLEKLPRFWSSLPYRQVSGLIQYMVLRYDHCRSNELIIARFLNYLISGCGIDLKSGNAHKMVGLLIAHERYPYVMLLEFFCDESTARYRIDSKSLEKLYSIMVRTRRGAYLHILPSILQLVGNSLTDDERNAVLNNLFAVRAQDPVIRSVDNALPSYANEFAHGFVGSATADWFIMVLGLIKKYKDKINFGDTERLINEAIGHARYRRGFWQKLPSDESAAECQLRQVPGRSKLGFTRAPSGENASAVLPEATDRNFPQLLPVHGVLDLIACLLKVEPVAIKCGNNDRSTNQSGPSGAEDCCVPKQPDDNMVSCADPQASAKSNESSTCDNPLSIA